MIQKELVHKYFQGQCNPEELKIILKWLNDDQADHTLLQEIMTTRWESGNNSFPTVSSGLAKENGPLPGEELKPRLLSALRQRLYPLAVPSLETTEVSVEQLPVIGSRRRFLRYGIAASLAGILLLGSYVFNYYRLRSLAAQWKSLTNTSTRMKYCLLPDSTRVWLNPKSTLSWSMPVGEQRTVRIEGQAFFDVARDQSRPFIVNSGPLVTNVLGTAFNIEAYPDEKDIRVSLVKGKVSVQHLPETDSGAAGMIQAPAQLLNAGEMLTYVRDAHASRKTQLKMTDLSDWTSGHLMFSEVPVTTALERLAQLYHFHLQYQKGIHLENYRFSTVFTKEERPEQMIKNILFITDYTYHIAGNEVEIVRK